MKLVKANNFSIKIIFVCSFWAQNLYLDNWQREFIPTGILIAQSPFLSNTHDPIYASMRFFIYEILLIWSFPYSFFMLSKISEWYGWTEIKQINEKPHICYTSRHKFNNLKLLKLANIPFPLLAPPRKLLYEVLECNKSNERNTPCWLS